MGTLKGGTHLMILLVSPILVINIFHGVVYFGRFRPLTTPTWIQTNFKKTSACPRQDGLPYACQEAFENQSMTNRNKIKREHNREKQTV